MVKLIFAWDTFDFQHKFQNWHPNVGRRVGCFEKGIFFFTNMSFWSLDTNFLSNFTKNILSMLYGFCSARLGQQILNSCNTLVNIFFFKLQTL